MNGMNMTRIQPLRIRVLQQFRRWHRWLGLVFLLPTVLLGVTGVFLNHKELFFGAAAPSQGLLTNSFSLDEIPVGVGEALARSRELWGDIPIEKFELREEQGRLVYKIVPGPGRELLIDARSGEWKLKEGLKTAQPAGKNEKAKLDWKKITTELHSGKIIGLTGRLLMDAAGLGLAALAITGLYLWWLPRWQRRQRAD
jgi:hypothetical protein